MRPKRKQNVVAKNAVRNKPKNPVKKNNWRDQHNQIQQVIKLGREMNALQAEGGADAQNKIAELSAMIP